MKPGSILTSCALRAVLIAVESYMLSLIWNYIVRFIWPEMPIITFTMCYCLGLIYEGIMYIKTIYAAFIACGLAYLLSLAFPSKIKYHDE